MEERSTNKPARLQQVVHLLYRNPAGLTTQALARHCGVTMRTVQRDLKDLEEAGIPLWEEAGRYGVVAGYYLPPVHFSLEEASVLYLAARLLARYSDEHNPLIVQALAKLAGALPATIAGHIHHTIQSLGYRPDNPAAAAVLQAIALGWATGRKVRIWHQAAGREEVRQHLFSPYFLEPSNTGLSTYAIGQCEPSGRVSTFKVERIQAAQLMDETFELPAGFDGAALLQNAWGVMYGPAGSEEEVVLRFSAPAGRRVRESIWHPSQVLEACADGGCLLRVRVAHPLEMKPWIRSWGPDCQVLAPPWLRAEVAAEMRRAAEAYGEKQAAGCKKQDE
jgi:proteasome accessory factor B